MPATLPHRLSFNPGPLTPHPSPTPPRGPAPTCAAGPAPSAARPQPLARRRQCQRRPSANQRRSRAVGGEARPRAGTRRLLIGGGRGWWAGAARAEGCVFPEDVAPARPDPAPASP